MNGLFGILNFDGQPVARESLESMCNRMACGYTDSSSIWQNENIGIGHLPSQHSASGVVLSAQARLDNRSELIADLRLPIRDHPAPHLQSSINHLQSTIFDNELILHAYLRWGEECVQHLIGDWSFAAWDPHQRKMFLARDPYGISSLYYYRHPRFFAFASSIKGLLALQEVPKRPNLLVVARLLTVWAGDGEEDRSQTAYDEIFCLLPAHTLTITADKVELQRYWDLENTPPLRLNSDDEYLEAFLEVYTEAVRCRLRPPLLSGERPGIGATLSSGLDSGSVCALAAHELRLCGQRLPVFTSVPIYDTQNTTPPGRYGDESPLVEINRQFIGNLDVHYIRAETISPLEGMRRVLEVHDYPMHGAGNEFWLHALLETARQQGLGILLTGQVGNGTISWAGGVENPWRSIQAGQWQTLWGIYKLSGRSPWKMIKRHLLRPLAKRAQAISRSAVSWDLVGRQPWAAYSAINPQWARSLKLGRRMKRSGHDPYFTLPSDPDRARLRMLSFTGGVGAVWAEMGCAYDLEVRDPTMDKRLMEFCLAIPNEQYRLDGQDRALIRRAMKGLLPDEVRLNTRRGLQAADLGYRLLAELPQVQVMLRRLEGSTLARQVLDLPRMKGVLQALQEEVNVRTTEECGTILTRGMMAGMFLLRFDG